MEKEPSLSTRRDELVDRLGGPPGRYVVVSVVLAVLWFPFRLILDSGDPTAAIVASSGLHGVVWALLPVAGEWLSRRVPGRAGGSADTRTATERRAWSRRGALVALGAGVPFYGAMLVLCVSTGRPSWYTASFGLVLLVIVAIALRNLRKNGATVP